MKRKISILLVAIALMASLLSACIGGNQPPAVPSTTQSTQQTQQSVQSPTPTASKPAVEVPRDIHDTGNKIEYLDAVPMTNLITAKKNAVRTTKPVKVPLITWGGDVATIQANGGRVTQPGSIFAQKGLSIELFREDNPLMMVEKVVSGETPCFRGTMDQVVAASEALQDRGIEMVVIYQMTWSTGGDTITVRSDLVQTPANLRGKQIGIQRYGPHMLYLATVIKDSGLTLKDVTIRWLRELSIPPYDSKGIAVDPMTAMQRDPNLSAVTVISPDMMALTSGGGMGTGAESSVKEAKLLLSTKTASAIIADVYAVRKDYFDANRQEVQSFVHGLMLAKEATVDLFNNRASRQAEYQNLLKVSADILRDSSQATADIEGLLMDCTFVGFPGNVQFFTGQGTLRTFDALTKESQDALIEYGFLTRRVALSQANWDYNLFVSGLRDTAGVTLPKFDPAKLEQFAQSGSAKEGVLFEFEIYFAPNQEQFPANLYEQEFDRILNLAAKYPGAIFIIEGHADPTAFLKAQKEGASQMQLTGIKTAAKSTSYKRAEAAREGLIAFAKDQAINLDTTQFTISGAGIDRPKFPIPQNEQEWAVNRRVVFQMVQIEAELEKFMPVGGK